MTIIRFDRCSDSIYVSGTFLVTINRVDTQNHYVSPIRRRRAGKIEPIRGETFVSYIFTRVLYTLIYTAPRIILFRVI